MGTNDFAPLRGAACIVGLVLLAGCTSTQTTGSISKETTKAPAPIAAPKKVYSYSAADRDCLKRAMYFESKRDSRDGLMAVGSVVMNRLTSGAYADTICGVVGQKRQFAPGVMTRKVHEKAMPDLDEAADAILRGERNAQVKEAMFFHVDGMKFPYDNMHYVTVAGGNAFYEKRDDDGELQTPPPQSPNEYMLSYAQHMSPTPSLMIASNVMGPPAPTTTPAGISASDPSLVADASGVILPEAVPVPLQRPQVANVASLYTMPTVPARPAITQMVSAPPQIWTLRTARP